jgi:hypothetical protein
MFAFVYRNGVIKIAPRRPRDATALPLAGGPRKVLTRAVSEIARKGVKKGVLLVPGVAEAESDFDALAAVVTFKERLEKLLPADKCKRFVQVREGA